MGVLVPLGFRTGKTSRPIIERPPRITEKQHRLRDVGVQLRSVSAQSQPECGFVSGQESFEGVSQSLRGPVKSAFERVSF